MSSHQSNRRRSAKIDAEKKIAEFYEVGKPKRTRAKKDKTEKKEEGAAAPAAEKKKHAPAKGKAKKGSSKKGKKEVSPAE
jgi:hypothetical protein